MRLKKCLTAIVVAVLLCSIVSGAYANDWLVSNKTTHKLTDVRTLEAYDKYLSGVQEALSFLEQGRGAFGGSTAYDLSKVDSSRPLVVVVSETGKIVTISSPLAEDVNIKSSDGNYFGGEKYQIFVHTIDFKKYFTGKNLAASFTHIGTPDYHSMLHIPLTKYVLGNLEYDTANFFNSIGSSSDENLKDFGRKFVQKMNGADGLDRKLKEGQDRIRKQFMFALPMSLIVLMLLVQLGLAMYDTSRGMASFPSILVRFVVYVFVLMTYEIWISFIIDLFSVITNFVVPVQAQQYIVANILSTSSISDFGDSSISTSVVLWLMDFVRYLGYIAIQILMIMRDVFLAITVMFGPLIIAISFPSSVSDRSPFSFARQMLSGWIEGFTRLMLWCPIGAACIVLLGLTTVLTSIGATSILALIVMTVSMMFACTKVPDLSEKMSGQGLAAVFATLGGTVTSTAGTAVGGTVQVTGSVMSGTGSMIFQRGKTAGAFGAGFAGNLLKETGQRFRKGTTSTVEEVKPTEGALETPHVQSRGTPL